VSGAKRAGLMGLYEECPDCGQAKARCLACHGLGRIGADSPRCRECQGHGVRCPDAVSLGTDCGRPKSGQGNSAGDPRSATSPGSRKAASKQPESSWQPGPVPPPGQAGTPEPASRPRAPEPSWATVLATTARLWAGRRLRWLRRLWPARARWRVAIVAALVAVVFVAGAATAALSAGVGPGRQGAGQPALAAAAARQRAAAWVASQVSADAIVACDPAMCAALQARGVPAGQLLVLSPGRADPLGSDVVVATAAVRNQFGARLAAVYAPVTLASFGGGAARIDVRAVAPDGGAAYQTQLAADVRDRQAAGAILLRSHRIQVAGAAAAELADGRVDARLLVTLAALAALYPVDIVSFGGAGQGASAGVPLRSADIVAVTPGGGAAHPASLQGVLAFLRAQRPPYLPPSLHTVRITPRRTVLQIEYRVPCPLGLLGGRS
jgi:hypothetical protein